MITCKDGHVRATGRAPELLADVGAITAALAEDSDMGWDIILDAATIGIEIGIKHRREKEANANG